MVLTHNHSIETIWIFAHWLIMVRSRNWPDLWWQISKIRDRQVVSIYDLMKRWRCETNRISSVATAQPQSQKPVFDFDLTWWPDLWWPGAEIFTQGVKFNCEQVLKTWRRCAPPFFRYPRKTGGVGIFCPPPPPPERVLNSSHSEEKFDKLFIKMWVGYWVGTYLHGFRCDLRIANPRYPRF